MKNKIKISGFMLLFSMVALVASSFSLYIGFPFLSAPGGTNDWVVPESAKKVKNPVKATADNIKAGKVLFEMHCKSCHGSKGKGDGNKAKSLNTPCGDFSEKGFQAQSDGSVFFKIREGKVDMPSFKKKIPDELEVWSIVNYMRTLGPSVVVEEPKKPATTEEKKKTTDPEVKKSTATEPSKKEVKPVIEKKDSATIFKDSLMLLEKNHITLVLTRYEKALNVSDTLAITSLFNSTGIYFPFLSATAVGTDQIKASYKKLFLLNKFNMKLSIDEIEQYADIAIVRANLKGEHTLIISNQKGPEDNRALIILKKINDDWKIYRLMIN